MREGLEELESIVNMLDNIGIKKEHYAIDFSIARGLGYYTGTVYETLLDDLPTMGSICSGGRYDNLTKSFSKDGNMSGVGASIGIDRLIAVLDKLGLIKEHNTTAQVLILNIDERYVSNIYQLATKLREADIKSEVYPDTMKFKKQMKYANLQGHEFVIILGENEIKNGVISLKNMESGKQVNMKSIEELIESIRGETYRTHVLK